MVTHAKCSGKAAEQVDRRGTSASARPASKYLDSDMVKPGGDWSRAKIAAEHPKEGWAKPRVER